MMSDVGKVAELSRKNGKVLINVVKRFSLEGDDAPLYDDDDRNDLLRDVFILNELALSLGTTTESCSSCNSAYRKSGEFSRHLRRAHIAHADGMLLMARHFSGLRSEAVAAWMEFDPYTLLKSTTPVDAAVNAVQEKAECLQRISTMTEKCLNLCHTMSFQLREIVEMKKNGIERLDTLSYLDDQEMYELKINVRGWLDDINKLTEELDDSIRIPKALNQIPRELFMAQKRFLYALMDVMEAVLQTRMASILSPNDEPPATLPLGQMLDELDVLVDPESHPFLELVHSIPHDISIQRLKSLVPSSPTKPLHLHQSNAEYETVGSSTPQKPHESYSRDTDNRRFHQRSVTAPRQHPQNISTQDPTINFPAYRARIPSYHTPYNASLDPHPHSPQAQPQWYYWR